MGWCQTLLPFLSNPLTYIGLLGAGIGGKLLYSYSSYTFWPQALAVSNILRVFGSISSILNFVWRSNILFAAAVITTFSNTIRTVLSGDYNGVIELVFVALTEIYDKIALTVKQIVDGLNYLAQWISQEGGTCMYINQSELLVAAVTSFWVAAAAYIFAIRLYDWIWGKGMTRDIEWPEVMLVVTVVTLISITVYGGSLVVEGLTTSVDLLEGVQNLTEIKRNGTGNVTG